MPARRSCPSAAAPEPGRYHRGHIVFDLNDNGQRDPGAANVTVLLNGRFPTRTDESGRYDFSFVAAGGQVISVTDNLPLPWVVGAPKFPVNVSARTTSTFDIPARRIR